MNNAKTIGYFWLSSLQTLNIATTCCNCCDGLKNMSLHTCIGAIACEHRAGWRCFIGVGLGLNEESDIQMIKDCGQVISEEFARAIFCDIEGNYIH